MLDHSPLKNDFCKLPSPRNSGTDILNPFHFGSGHICGCYYLVNHQRRYLPQVTLESHTIISPVSFTTHLKQTFSNSSSENLPKVRYTFPLYDGVAVGGYTISYDGKTLRGVVKQKDVAKTMYQAAANRGETAGLLEPLPASIFSVTLANVPPGQDLTINISYCGELKHDSQIDGLRFMIPTSIAPRYGNYPGILLQSNVATKGGIRITVDIDMPGSTIRKVQSQSHPVAVTVGELSQQDTSTPAGRSARFSSSQASATLALGSAELQDDFMLQILADDLSSPRAVIETHAVLPEQRAIMATVVPKFSLEQANAEIVFIADQSGSMSGSRNQSLVAALKVLLKSLPLGVRFNICAFGSRSQFLWPKSVPYSEDNLNTAIGFVDTFTAAYGGTELLEPIRQVFERHLKDLPLEVMLLTDGQVWAETEIFNFINKEIRDNKVDARIFTLGIGQEVSHTLVNGAARAGNGSKGCLCIKVKSVESVVRVRQPIFAALIPCASNSLYYGFAQFVQNELEEIYQKVIRMLKGALCAHTTNYTLEVHFEESDATADEADMVIVDMIHDHLFIDEKPKGNATTPPARPKSFFDPSLELDDHPRATRVVERYAHLPDVQPPAILQAPATIPPLFPFNRTSLYLLLGPASPQKVVTSLTIRATSPEGPSELKIPVYATKSGTSIHQLAVRKAIQDLEEGRGWMQSATVQGGPEMKEISVKEKYESRFDELVEREAVRIGEQFCVAGKFTSFVAVSDESEKDLGHVEINTTDAMPEKYGSSMVERGMLGGGSMHTTPQSGMMATQVPSVGLLQASGSSLMSMQAPQHAMMLQAHPPTPVSAPFAKKSSSVFPKGVFRGTAPAPTQSLALYGSSTATANAETSGSTIHQIISLQTFAGAWQWEKELLRLIRRDESQVNIAKLGGEKDVAATVLAVAYLETVLHAKKDVWEMIVAKARVWLGKQVGGSVERVEELIRSAVEDF